MAETREFLMPDYFPSFHCKMGACRHACCDGWPIAFALTDYFKLINAPCSEELQKKIERGVKIELHPTPDRYAVVYPGYDGSCPMRLPDGRCALHAELGEDALAAVCRLYPRGVRHTEGTYSVCCAGSCEGVLELLFTSSEPISFIRRPLTIEVPAESPSVYSFKTKGHAVDLRLWFIRLMQDRRVSLPARLLIMKEYLVKLDAVLNHGTEQDIQAFLANYPESIPEAPDPEREHLISSMELAEKMLTLIDEDSTSLQDMGSEVLEYFGSDKHAFDRYRCAAYVFESRFPDHMIRMEHMLVNHMFFSCFPFQDRPESPAQEYVSLCVVYSLLRFLCIGHAAMHSEENDLTDACAAALRLIEHTDFDAEAARLLRDSGCKEEDVDALILL